jgi:transposase-like protein
VSRICADLDTEVGAFRDRSLAEQSFPYVFLDATYCKARVNHRVVSQAVVIATGVRADGWREVLGFAVGDTHRAITCSSRMHTTGHDHSSPSSVRDLRQSVVRYGWSRSMIEA